MLSENGELTDFGSSRNVNMLMTNMTFTQGIGSPTKKAPEVINKEKYKKLADVFSFGVTMKSASAVLVRTRRASSSHRGRSHRLS